MKRPEPKAELVVKIIADEILGIYTASQDAREWVMNEASAFGELFLHGDNSFDLFVSPLYDTKAVADYLRQEGA